MLENYQFTILYHMLQLSLDKLNFSCNSLANFLTGEVIMSTGTYIHVDWVPCTHIIPECSATEWQTSMFYGEVYSVSEHVHCTIVCCCPYGMLYQILKGELYPKNDLFLNES